MTKEQYEALVARLVGRRIVDVRYHEILYKDENNIPLDEPEWNRNPAFDSIDFGIDLDFSDGSMCHLRWGSEFVQYNLSVLFTPQKYADIIRIWPVAESNHWRPLLNQRIVSVKLDWDWEQYEGQQRVDFPQTMCLTFENGSDVFVSAFEIRDDDFQHGSMDHITVFFDRQTAERYGAWASS